MVVRVVEHEARFDDDEREAWIAKWEYDQSICKECGNPRSVCSNAGVDWFPQRSVCYARASREAISRRWDKIHEKDNPVTFGDYEVYPTDGVSLWVSDRDLTPDDDFLSGPDSEAARVP